LKIPFKPPNSRFNNYLHFEKEREICRVLSWENKIQVTFWTFVKDERKIIGKYFKPSQFAI